MEYKYGYSLVDWNTAREEMRQILVQRAKVRGVIAYSELVREVESIRLDPHSYALNTMLWEITLEEDAAGRGMLTVIVVHKGGDYQPGPGFFDAAQGLGRDTSDLLACWVAELKKVHTQWSTTRRR